MICFYAHNNIGVMKDKKYKCYCKHQISQKSIFVIDYMPNTDLTKKNILLDIDLKNFQWFLSLRSTPCVVTVAEPSYCHTDHYQKFREVVM
jgi:hypothetical protein